MQPSANGVALIKLFESFRAYPYLDGNKIWTIAWGHVLTTPDGRQISEKVFGVSEAARLCQEAMQRLFGAPSCTREQGDALFVADCNPRAAALSTRVAPDTTQTQFDALLCFDYNVGLGGFDNSSVKRLHNSGRRDVGEISIHDLWTKLQQMPTPTTIPVAFVEWAHVGGKPSLGLFRRCVAEVLVYSGWDAQRAYDTVYQFQG